VSKLGCQILTPYFDTLKKNHEITGYAVVRLKETFLVEDENDLYNEILKLRTVYSTSRSFTYHVSIYHVLDISGL